jgi:SAM-dependent methyltransferase
VVLVHDAAPGFGPVDVVERGQWARVGRYVPLDDYAPLALDEHSADLVTCYIGLHHAPPERLEAFVRSIARVLRPGGVFVLRDHDVTSPDMDAFVALAHAVFNAGLGLPWAENHKERRHFAPIAEWSRRVEAAGLVDGGRRLAQAHDPSDNLLLAFTKPPAGAAS